jgi:type IV secretory pathway VirB10-like protein
MPPSASFATAGGGIEGLIYFIIIALWVLGKVLRKKKPEERQAAPRRSYEPQPSESEIPPDLREMLETLTGQKFEPARAPPPPAPSRVEGPPPVPSDIPKRRKQAAAVAERKAELAAESAELAEQEKKFYAQAASRNRPDAALTVAMRSISAGMKIIQTPALRAGIAVTMSAQSSDPSELNFLKDREALRRAIICREVLGKPKAFE